MLYQYQWLYCNENESLPYWISVIVSRCDGVDSVTWHSGNMARGGIKIGVWIRLQWELMRECFLLRCIYTKCCWYWDHHIGSTHTLLPEFIPDNQEIPHREQLTAIESRTKWEASVKRVVELHDRWCWVLSIVDYDNIFLNHRCCEHHNTTTKPDSRLQQCCEHIWYAHIGGNCTTQMPAMCTSYMFEKLLST